MTDPLYLQHQKDEREYRIVFLRDRIGAALIAATSTNHQAMLDLNNRYRNELGNLLLAEDTAPQGGPLDAAAN